MKRTFKIRRMVCFVLAIAVVVIGSVSFPASAAQSPEDTSKLYISDRAAQNGVYECDSESHTVKFIPPEEYGGGLTCENDIDVSEGILPMTSSTPVLSVNGSEPTVVTTPTSVQLSTCLIGATFQEGGDEHVAVGTGWLISNTYLVTAGHCIYNKKYENNGNNGFALYVDVYVGSSNGTYKQYRRGQAKYVGGDFHDNSVEPEYSNTGMYDDWGVIKLNNPITVSVSMLKLHTVSGVSDMTGSYVTQGYPSDTALNIKKKNWEQYYMYKDTCNIKYSLEPWSVEPSVEPNIIGLVGTTDLQLHHGQSGSPLHTYRSGIGNCAEGIAVCEKDDVSCFILMNSWLTNYLSKLI